MKKTKIVWIIFGSKLPSYFLMSAIYFFLKCPGYRQTQASIGNVQNTVNTQRGLDRLWSTHFLTLLYPCLSFDPYFENHLGRSTNLRNVVLSCSDKSFLTFVQIRGNNRLWLHFRKCTTIFTFA